MNAFMPFVCSCFFFGSKNQSGIHSKPKCITKLEMSVNVNVREPTHYILNVWVRAIDYDLSMSIYKMKNYHFVHGTWAFSCSNSINDEIPLANVNVLHWMRALRISLNHFLCALLWIPTSYIVTWFCSFDKKVFIPCLPRIKKEFKSTQNIYYYFLILCDRVGSGLLFQKHICTEWYNENRHQIV